MSSVPEEAVEAGSWAYGCACRGRRHTEGCEKAAARGWADEKARRRRVPSAAHDAGAIVWREEWDEAVALLWAMDRTLRRVLADNNNWGRVRSKTRDAAITQMSEMRAFLSRFNTQGEEVNA